MNNTYINVNCYFKDIPNEYNDHIVTTMSLFEGEECQHIETSENKTARDMIFKFWDDIKNRGYTLRYPISIYHICNNKKELFSREEPNED